MQALSWNSIHAGQPEFADLLCALEVELVWIFHKGYLRIVSYEGFGSKRLFLQCAAPITWDPQHLLTAGEYLLYKWRGNAKEIYRQHMNEEQYGRILKTPFLNSCQSSGWHAEILQVWVGWCKCFWGWPEVFLVFTLPALPATVNFAWPLPALTWLLNHLLKNFSSCMTSKAICVAAVLNLQFSHMFSVWLEGKKLQSGCHLAQRASDLLCVLSANRNWGDEVFGSVFSCCSLHCLITNLWMSSQPLFHPFGEGKSGGSVSGSCTREGGVWPTCLWRFAKAWLCGKMSVQSMGSYFWARRKLLLLLIAKFIVQQQLLRPAAPLLRALLCCVQELSWLESVLLDKYVKVGWD